MAEVIIIGAGPAGISAALTLYVRGRDVLLVSNDPLESPLAHSARIDNYPGLPQISGVDMMRSFIGQVEQAGIDFRRGRVISALPFGAEFMVRIADEIEQARALIMAVGVVQTNVYPGEAKLLGRGVSYCATCDGMLYRGKPVCVVGKDAEAQAEANFLAGIGCDVTYVSTKRADSLEEGVTYQQARELEIEGNEKVSGLKADGTVIPCDAVFVLRPAIAPSALITGLDMTDSSIQVDDAMATNIPGLFAAGDCTGKPWQIAKAVGQGQIAAFSADAYLGAGSD